MKEGKLKHLFSPITIKTMELKNRIVMPPMGTGFGELDGTPSQRSIDYYAARAQGGVGLIIVEVTGVHSSGKMPGVLSLHDDSLIPRWRDLANAVHAHGAKIIPQLSHPGRQVISAITGTQLLAASAIPCPMMKETPKEMTKEDIEEIVEAYGEAARRAKEAGMDGVEIHGAHGYLICNFMSPWSNKRTDEYGGSLSGRLRFALEVIESVRAKCGTDFPMTVRLSCDEMVKGGLVPEEVEIICRILAEAGVDVLSISRGNYGAFRWFIPPGAVPIAVNASFTERVKKLVDIPVIVAHRIHDPLVAEHILAMGKADLVAMGRALIADPDLPRKAAAGQFEDIAPCIACNQGCLQRLMVLAMPVSCLVNPAAGREREMVLVPAKKPKKVLVAGGGPAGLEAARVAALRGHQVVLYEKTNGLGGQFNLAAVPPTKQEFAKAIRYLSTQVRKAGVKLELGKEVTPEVVDQLKPDVVIIATGGAPLIPGDLPGVDKPIVAAAHDVLAGGVTMGDKVVIVGGGLVGCETADYVGERGAREITIVEMLPDVAMDMVPWTKEFLLERLNGYRVNILTSAKVKEILDDGVVFTRNGKEEPIRGVNNVILAMGVKSVNELSEEVSDKVGEVYVIGDAKEPRKGIDAIAEGAEVGRRI